MFLLPLIYVSLLIYGGGVAKRHQKKGSANTQDSCRPSLGIPKEPCPPCAKSTWTYLTSDSQEDDLDHAEPVLTADAPHWLGCLEKPDKDNSFSPYGVEQKEFSSLFSDPNYTGPNPSNKEERFDLDVTVLFQPTIPCEIQVVRCPPEKVIECKDKLMLAHEDEYRRQCKETFVKNFEYEIQKGSYDEDLAAFWLEYDADFVRKDEEGNLQVTYDYTTFGCPIEPYQEDHFAPDLRILLPSMNRNTTLGLKYNHSYILIEIFGTTGFLLQEDGNENSGYTWNPEHNENLCTGKPQTLVEMLKIWKRDEPFIPKTTARDPLSIWKNYTSCNDTPPASRPSWKNGQYQIMNNRKNDSSSGKKPNMFIWNTANKRPETLIFLAISVDDPDCNYYSLFGVSLPKPTELDNLQSLLWFILFTLLWLLLVVLGYYWRKAQIRRQYFEEARSQRLKQSAWAVIYRYEKLLHESENKHIDKEMADYARSQNSDKDKSVPESGSTTEVNSKKKN